MIGLVVAIKTTQDILVPSTQERDMRNKHIREINSHSRHVRHAHGNAATFLSNKELSTNIVPLSWSTND